MFLTIFLLFFVTSILIYNYIKKHNSDRWRKLKRFPGDATLPILGNSLQFGFNADDTLQKLLAIWIKHGKQNFRFTANSQDIIFLSDPDDIGVILNHPTEHSKTLNRNTSMQSIFGDSLPSSEGEKWRLMRNLMKHSFHFKNLQKVVENLNTSSNRLFDIFDTYENNGPVDVYRYLTPYMCDFISETIMGVESNLLADPDNLYIRESENVAKIITRNSFLFWINFPLLFQLTPSYRHMKETIKTMRQYSARIINERRKKLNKPNKNMNSEFFIEKTIYDGYLLDKLLLTTLNNGESIPDQIISDEVTFFNFTGYLLAKVICHTLYCLAKHPKIQRKLIEEFRTILKDDFHKKLTNIELNQLKYLEAVIKETIRVFPSVGSIGRQLRNEVQLKDGRVAPAGVSVVVFYRALYQNPKVFPEPEKYIPERHLEPKHTYSLVPFGAGARACLGFRLSWAAMKITLSNILRRYEVFPGGPGTEPEFAYRILTESKNGIQLRFKKRNL